LLTLESAVQTYGYWAILAGTFLEGETILILGGFAAYSGYLELPWVIAAAFTGTFCGDQLFFFLGRWHSRRFLANRPSWKRRVEKAQKLFKRIRTPLMLGFRFMYGLRSVTPFVIGMSDVPTALFVFLNMLGAAVWAITVGIAGYFFGGALEIFVGNIKRYELFAFAAIALAGLAIWLLHLHRGKKGRPSK
jgi:membrane protein DedA with SNARE-associated domain